MEVQDGIHDNLKVIVCDDSALMRNLISKIIDDIPGMTVIAKATNGQNLLDLLKDTSPDVIMLDIEMPIMTGVEFLKERKKQKINIPVVILSSIATKGATVTMECLELGASDFITKPGSSVSLNIDTVSEEIIEKIASYGGAFARSKGKRISFTEHFLRQLKIQKAVKLVEQQKGIQSSESATQIQSEPVFSNLTKKVKEIPVITPLRPGGKIKVIAIGISTGGPNALRTVFKMIDPHLTQPILVVQHMPAGFTTEFANSLDKLCPLKVVEAQDGMPLENAHVYIAPGSYHITVAESAQGIVIHTNQNELRNGHRPSADVLFESVNKVFKNNALAVIMTGMGKDGADEITELRKQGSWTLGQDEESSIVYGMPRVAYELGGVQKQVSLNNMADEISKLARENR